MKLRLNYHHYQGQSKFSLSEPEDLDPDTLKEIKDEFFHSMEYNQKMEDYINLHKQENKIIQERKKLLNELKHDFEKYVTSSYPEVLL